MAQSKNATIGDVEEIVKVAFDELSLRLAHRLGSAYNKKDLEDIKQHLIEIKTEMRMIRVLYSFWAEQNLSPEFMEKFLQEFSNTKSLKVKRLD